MAESAHTSIHLNKNVNSEPVIAGQDVPVTRDPQGGLANRFGGIGLGFDHLKPALQNSSEAYRRRCSSNYMDGILSDPKRWNDAVNDFVQETFEDEDV